MGNTNRKKMKQKRGGGTREPNLRQPHRKREPPAHTGSVHSLEVLYRDG